MAKCRKSTLVDRLDAVLLDRHHYVQPTDLLCAGACNRGATPAPARERAKKGNQTRMSHSQQIFSEHYLRPVSGFDLMRTPSAERLQAGHGTGGVIHSRCPLIKEE
jgi:hypothetical protein